VAVGQRRAMTVEHQTDTEGVLRRPEFWATHYYNIVGNEHHESGELINVVFGLTNERLDEYYFSLVRPEERALLITVAVLRYYDVGVQYVDCHEHGTQVRYSLGHEQWPQRELLGYDSPHFALPAFRWAEVDLIARAVEQSSPDHAAMARLLLFPAVSLTRQDDTDVVTRTLLAGWKQLGLTHSGHEQALIRSAVENRLDPELTWSHDPELGWINDGIYSFRNPNTLMTRFDAKRFARIRDLWVAIEHAVGP
jgi:hypothetical protein